MQDQNTTADSAVSMAGLETIAARLDAIAATLMDPRTSKAGFEVPRLMGWLGSLTEQTAMELRAGGRLDSDGRCLDGLEVSSAWPERTAAFLDELAARAAQ